MKDNLNIFTAKENISIFEALKQIDKNRKGFLIIINDEGMVLGTLTDGDIRRAFIKGVSEQDKVSDICVRSFKKLTSADDISLAVDMFKNESIKFIPVTDEAGRLENIITKDQMHSIMLLDIHADLKYDFFSLDDNIVNHEIFQRPWGFYKTTVMNNYFQSKVISLKPGAQLSLQSHEHREEYWIIAHGTGKVQLDASVVEVRRGSTVYIPKGCRHRAINTDDRESLIITEVQIGDYFGEDDIIRYEDIYGRV